MRSFHQLALLALPLLARASGGDAEPSPTKATENAPKAFYNSPNEAFQDLLNALPEESLHVALNSLGHFRDGIFESDRHGVERVHHDNPPLATRLIVAAVQDLKKRQTPSNGTTTQGQQTTDQTTTQGQQTETADQSTQAGSEQTSQAAPAPRSSAVVIPVAVPTTDAQGRSTTETNTVLAPATASVAVPVTTTNAQGQSGVTTQNRPAVILSGTDSRGSAFTTTSAVNFAPTAGQVMTTTDARGSTFLTTYTPKGGKVSSLVLLTSTGADGQPTVVTSYTFVDPAAATETGGAVASGTNTARPGLQSGAAVGRSGAEAAMLGGVVGGALALFV